MRIRYSLEWLESGEPRRDLTPGRYRVGRDHANDVVLDAQGVSRFHAEIEVCRDQGLVVRDLGSTNGTRLGGKRINEAAFAGDTELLLGSARLRLSERSSGLDELSYRSVAEIESGERSGPAAAPTSSVDLEGELRSLAILMRPSEGWSAAHLARLLAAWSNRVNGAALQIVDSNDAVIASSGGADEDASIVLADVGSWRLLGAAQTEGSQHAWSAIGTDLLLFAPLPIAGPSGASGNVSSSVDTPGLPTASASMRGVLTQLERAARGGIPVMLLGETGVGKDLVARWLHRRSNRSSGPFLALNCAALPRDLIESELFGVERGAATGVGERAGLIEQANGGTLFLDEVGDTAPETQVRLLRAIEEGQILRLGGRRPIAVDVRLVSATNRDLTAEVDLGHFRLDLYHRLAGFTSTIPSLRERGEDIVPLAVHFFEQALTRLGRRSPGITRAALLAIQRHRWPGNVRELRLAIERAVTVLDQGEALDRVHLPEQLRDSPNGVDELRLEKALEKAERECLITALAISGGPHEGAWQLLGIGKTSFYKKLREHGLGRATDEIAGAERMP
jgi:transcriptional regulator with AAA-type ATPase domain